MRAYSTATLERVLKNWQAQFDAAVRVIREYPDMIARATEELERRKDSRVEVN